VLEQSLFSFAGKGVFVKEIEQALLEKRVDLAVHSMKDLPSENPPELVVAAIPTRESPNDVIIGPAGKPTTLASLPAGAIVGTSSLRRRSLLAEMRPDLTLIDVRGNVDTRLRKLDEGQFAALCMAEAGLNRLGLSHRISERLPVDSMIPAPAQGAIAIETRRDDLGLFDVLTELHHAPTATAVTAERTLMKILGGGCAFPLGAYATLERGGITLRASMQTPKSPKLERRLAWSEATPEAIGAEMAADLRRFL
jgi:hydroxymethylbilane synthase